MITEPSLWAGLTRTDEYIKSSQRNGNTKTKAPAVNENESLLRFERQDYIIPTLCNSSTIIGVFLSQGTQPRQPKPSSLE